MAIRVSEFYQKIPEGTIPEALVSSIAVALSDRGVLTPSYVSNFTESVTKRLELKPPSDIRSDDRYLYHAFSALIQVLMKVDQTFNKSSANQVAVDLLLSNPSFRDWVCSQSVMKEIKSNIYRFMAKFSGQTISGHMQAHLCSSLRENVVEPILCWFYTDKDRLLEEVAKVVRSQAQSKLQFASEIKSEAQRIASSESSEEIMDASIDLARSLVSGCKKLSVSSPSKVRIFFELLASPKPKEILNVLSIHGMAQTSFVSFIYVRPSVEDLTVRSLAVVLGSYTDNTALCAITAHTVLALRSKQIIPSRTDRQLIKLFQTVQQETRNGLSHVRSTIQTEMDTKGVSPLVQKYVLSFPQLMIATIFAEFFYRDASHIKTAMYMPYLIEYFGYLLSDHWKICDANTFTFDHKFNKIILQLVVGTTAQVVIPSNMQIVPAVLSTPFMLDQIEESKAYQSFIKRVSINSGSAKKLIKNLKRTSKVFSLTIDVASAVSPSVISWGSRAVGVVTVGVVGRVAHKNKKHLQKVGNTVSSVVKTGFDVCAVYYRVKLAANIVGKKVAPAIEVIADPSNLSKLAGLGATSLVQHISEDSPFAAVATGQAVEMMCERLGVFKYKNLQSRATRNWERVKTDSIKYASHLVNRAKQMLESV